eukprot:768779-Hanusia_phi.AAC.3
MYARCPQPPTAGPPAVTLAVGRAAPGPARQHCGRPIGPPGPGEQSAPVPGTGTVVGTVISESAGNTEQVEVDFGNEIDRQFRLMLKRARNDYAKMGRGSPVVGCAVLGGGWNGCQAACGVQQGWVQALTRYPEEFRWVGMKGVGWGTVPVKETGRSEKRPKDWYAGDGERRRRVKERRRRESRRGGEFVYARP